MGPMDDQPTEPAPPQPALPPPPPAALRPPPPSPALPPPPPPRTPIAGWVVPADANRSAIDVASIIGRSFDTFGREWSLFLALAAPAALGSLLQAILAPPLMAGAAAPEIATLEDLWPMVGGTVLGATFGLLSTVLITVAADRLWQGLPTGLMDAFRGGLAALPRYLGVILLLALALAGVAIVAAVVAAVSLSLLGPVGIVVIVVGLLVVVPVAVWIGARLTLLVPVIVLERNGVPGSIERAWRLSRGHALLLFVLSIAIGLCAALPLWSGSLVSAFVTDPLVAGIALAIATLVYQPLPVIAMTLAWGDRIGSRHADSEVMARGRGRMIGALLVLGLGVVLMLIGFGLGARYASTVPAFP